MLPKPQIMERRKQRDPDLSWAVQHSTASPAHESHLEAVRPELVVGKIDVGPRAKPADCDRRLKIVEHKRWRSARRFRHFPGQPFGHRPVGLEADPAGQPDRNRPARTAACDAVLRLGS